MNNLSKLSIAIISALSIYLSSCSQKPQSNEPAVMAPPTTQLKRPDIPLAITTDEGKKEYLTANFWEHFDFNDTTIIANSEYTEQAFADFIQLLERSKNPDIGINNMLTKASKETKIFDYFVDLSEKYLYNPNSPMLNEELFLPVLKFILTSDNLDESKKIRPEYQMKMLLKNRKGTIAADFGYKTDNDKTGRMHAINSDYTILFFNDPDCEDCRTVKTYMSQSQIYNRYVTETGLQNKNAKRLTILAIYAGSATDEWKAAKYPDIMLNANDPNLLIQNKELYDLRAFPSLYLLDKHKQVILKDATVRKIESWLAENAG
ncbi:MAG: DUF5106 domain-containing protein [Bacteroidales bacterium]